MMISDPRQCTVCGPDRPVFALMSSPEITVCSFGFVGSFVSMTLMFDVRTPGINRNRRFFEPSWWQLEQAFHPEWCSSSPICGISVRAITLE